MTPPLLVCDTQCSGCDQVSWPGTATRRQANCAYTPDALLTVPALVNGHVVHWVDSKAMYGYDASWRYVKEQICNYVAFCGSGLVIFWHGLAPGLQALVGPSVLVLQDLPEPQHIT